MALVSCTILRNLARHDCIAWFLGKWHSECHIQIEASMKSLLVILSVLIFFIITPAMAQTVEDGIASIQSGDYEDAKSILLPLVKSGNAKAMNAIGRMYNSGRGYVKNTKTACDWYEEAALVGYVSAQNNLGLCFEKGDGRPKNIKKALYWMEEAAKQGLIICQIRLMNYYHTVDMVKAKYWGEKAAEAGSKVAQAALWSYAPDEYDRPSFLAMLCISVAPYIPGVSLMYCD